MSNADLIVGIGIVLGILLIASLVLIWAFRILAVLAVAFVAFMLSLPVLIMILVFVLFPPTLLVFLVGWLAMIFDLVGEDHAPSKRPWFESTEDRIKRERRELGYDTEEHAD